MHTAALIVVCAPIERLPRVLLCVQPEAQMGETNKGAWQLLMHTTQQPAL